MQVVNKFKHKFHCRSHVTDASYSMSKYILKGVTSLIGLVFPEIKIAKASKNLEVLSCSALVALQFFKVTFVNETFWGLQHSHGNSNIK